MTHRVEIALERREIVASSLLRAERQAFASLTDVHVADHVELDVRNALRLPVTLEFPPTPVQTFSTEWVTVRWVIKLTVVSGRNAAKGLIDISAPVPDESELVRVDWDLDVPVVVIKESLEELRLEPSVDNMVLQ
jgi:hypothetical protein